jgi:hypothetical protein
MFCLARKVCLQFVCLIIIRAIFSRPELLRKAPYKSIVVCVAEEAQMATVSVPSIPPRADYAGTSYITAENELFAIRR